VKLEDDIITSTNRVGRLILSTLIGRLHFARRPETTRSVHSICAFGGNFSPLPKNQNVSVQEVVDTIEKSTRRAIFFCFFFLFDGFSALAPLEIGQTVVDRNCGRHFGNNSIRSQLVLLKLR